MRVLVVYCHPVETSYCASLCRTACDSLAMSGHEVRLLDLYAEGFQPVVSLAQRGEFIIAGRFLGLSHAGRREGHALARARGWEGRCLLVRRGERRPLLIDRRERRGLLVHRWKWRLRPGWA